MNQLATMEQVNAQKRIADAIVQSGYFKDAGAVAQAFVKVQAGAELGLPPVASMTGIHIVKGKPSLGANIIAALIKNDPRYNYRVLELTDAVCRIQFYEDGEECGVSEFTTADAQKAGTQNMAKFPRNMLFARAISNGAKWYVPGIFGGVTVYTPEELGAEVDEDGDIVIEGSLIEPDEVTPGGHVIGTDPTDFDNDVVDEPTTTPPPSNGNGHEGNGKQAQKQHKADTKQVTIPMLKDLHILGDKVYKLPETDMTWKEACDKIHAEYGTSSTKEWTWSQYWEVRKALEEQQEAA